MFYKSYSILALIILFNFGITGSTYSTTWPCVMPDCPTSCGESGGGRSTAQNLIERTWLSKNHSKRVTQKSLMPCVNPALSVSIDSADMAAIVAVGNRRTQLITDTSLMISMNVGVEGNDTQFWTIPTVHFTAQNYFESIPVSSSPYAASFPNTNVVFKGKFYDFDTVYVHSELGDSSLLRKGHGIDNFGSPEVLDFLETKAFLPIECGWVINETITTEWIIDPDIDSIQENKQVTIRSTGMLTPINEDPVPAILTLVQYTHDHYKDGIIFFQGGYDALVWFSTEGHMLVGYLADGAPLEGETTFSQMAYEKNIFVCPPKQQLGIDLLPGTYRAQGELSARGTLTNSLIKFVAGQGVNLGKEFSTGSSLDIFIDADPCTVNL